MNVTLKLPERTKVLKLFERAQVLVIPGRDATVQFFGRSLVLRLRT